MRYLFYTNYQSGGAGLTNAIMSIECGVVLAHLTERTLVLDGNRPPPANLVAYDGRVDDRQRSRVTDLIEMTVTWAESDAVALEGLESAELTNLSFFQFAFRFPKTLDVSTHDARSFARGREWVTIAGKHERVPVLRVSEKPLVPESGEHRSNLGFYGYQFYLDEPTRASVYRMLQRMQPKRPFAELAARVARDIGPFNAVHIRRGDFKATFGVTTLERKPSEAIEALDSLFSRDEPLVILTDERDDPFFDEIKFAYPRHFFIDWHILDHYGAQFAELPRSDGLSLAYLSQLIAAESKEFIGTMTSTFTSLIQRYRGNRGKPEAFRFLWNELPDPGQPLDRGRHVPSNNIALDRGEMIEKYDGPYSWNRVSQLLNPAWQREWPESFLTPDAVATGALACRRRVRSVAAASPRAPSAARECVLAVSFEGLRIVVRSTDVAVLQRLGQMIRAHHTGELTNVIARLEVVRTGTNWRIDRSGRSDGIVCEEPRLVDVLRDEIVTTFARARQQFVWLAAKAFVRSGRGLVIAGEVADVPLRRALGIEGWDVLDSALCAVNVDDLAIVPLAAERTPLAGLVVASKPPLHARDSIAAASPAATVAALIGTLLGNDDRHRAIGQLCRIVERRPVARLDWTRPREAARLVTEWAEAWPAWT